MRDQFKKTVSVREGVFLLNKLISVFVNKIIKFCFLQKFDLFCFATRKQKIYFKKLAVLLGVSEKCSARINTLQSYLWTRGRLSQSSSTQPCLEDLPQLKSCAATRLSSWSRRTFPSKPPNNGAEQRNDKESVDCWGCSEDSSPWRLTRIHVTTENGNCTRVRQTYILAVFYLEKD